MKIKILKNIYTMLCRQEKNIKIEKIISNYRMLFIENIKNGIKNKEKLI